MTVTSGILVALLGVVITLSIFTYSLIYKQGHRDARLESLEVWRNNMRVDMHEISDKLQQLSNQLTNLTALIEERTERRGIERVK